MRWSLGRISLLAAGQVMRRSHDIVQIGKVRNLGGMTLPRCRKYIWTHLTTPKT